MRQMEETEAIHWPLVEISRKKKSNIIQDIFVNSIKRLSKKMPLIAPLTVHAGTELQTMASGVPSGAMVQIIFPDDRIYSLSNPGESLATNDGFTISYLTKGEIEFKIANKQKYTGTIVKIIKQEKELAKIEIM